MLRGRAKEEREIFDYDGGGDRAEVHTLFLCYLKWPLFRGYFYCVLLFGV